MKGDTTQPLGLVVGGANGIGAACSKLMRERGWSVIIADRDMDSARELANGISAEALELDVTDAATVEAAALRFSESGQVLQGLVVSSGTFQQNIPISETDPDDLERILKVNFAGTYRVLRAFGLTMARKRGGSIVTLSSVLGHVSTPLNIYGPTKAAVLNMTKSLASEWGRSGVRVNSVSPGITLVPRVRARKESGTRYPKDIDDHMALGRCVEPEEVAEAVEFLLSARASAITGTDLLVDCGWVAGGLWSSYGGLRPSLAE
jgi:NAD(P)-dependent dehydrogenase (short-subunit alcohol dehydrogenase family)